MDNIGRDKITQHGANSSVVISNGGKKNKSNMWQTLKKVGLLMGIVVAVITALNFFASKENKNVIPISDNGSRTINNVTSHNQSGGITGGVVNFGNIDRQLTPEITLALDSILPVEKNGSPIIIKALYQDGETLRFADKFKEYFTSRGYKAELFHGSIIYAKEWPAEINIIPDAEGRIKEILLNPQKNSGGHN